MTFHCPHCHQPIAQPPTMTLTQTRIFNFLLANPNTSKRAIEIGVYGRPLPDSSVVISTISYISRKLLGTGYHIIHSGTLRSRRYTITHTLPAFESTHNGIDKFDRSLS